MRILIDIGHPAHVHYFKNFTKIMEGKGHRLLITARDRKHIFKLLEVNNIQYVSRGKGYTGAIAKVSNMPKISRQVYQIARQFRPDLLLSFASMYAAQAAKFLRKPHIAFDDTEDSTMGRIFYMPFTDVVCTPTCFLKQLGRKQVRFDSYMELSYLHSRFFQPDPTALEELGMNDRERFSVIRFVAWDAFHDIGKNGISNSQKVDLVHELEKYGKVFISSENQLPGDLQHYQLQISPERMHDLLSYATLFVGEGATMASECGVLGTPSIYISARDDLGYLTEQQDRYGIISCYKNFNGVIERVVSILKNPEYKSECGPAREKLLKEKIDTTAFMVWFVENFPVSWKLVSRDSGIISRMFAWNTTDG